MRQSCKLDYSKVIVAIDKFDPSKSIVLKRGYLFVK